MQDILIKYQNPEVAVRLQTADSEQFNLRNFEDILVSKEKTYHLMQKNKEALLQYVEDIKNLRNLILNDIEPSSTNSDSAIAGADKKDNSAQQNKQIPPQANQS